MTTPVNTASYLANGVKSSAFYPQSYYVVLRVCSVCEDQKTSIQIRDSKRAEFSHSLLIFSNVEHFLICRRCKLDHHPGMCDYMNTAIITCPYNFLIFLSDANANMSSDILSYQNRVITEICKKKKVTLLFILYEVRIFFEI